MNLALWILVGLLALNGLVVILAWWGARGSEEELNLPATDTDDPVARVVAERLRARRDHAMLTRSQRESPYRRHG